MKRALFIEGGRLQELPDMEEPILGLSWEYFKAKESCRILPAPDCKFKVGEVYKEGVHYRVEWQMDFNGGPFAVPIQASEESQDELWEEAVRIEGRSYNEMVELLKSKFHITRKND